MLCSPFHSAHRNKRPRASRGGSLGQPSSSPHASGRPMALHKPRRAGYNYVAQPEELPGVVMSEPRPLHRLFGLSWIDFFQGTAVSVETEMDLSLKQQFVDLVLNRQGLGPLPRRLPDGFEDLAPHNLVTFKSHQEALDCWALWELVGHFVNSRKQSSPSLQELLPETAFRLFAV